MVAVKTNYSYYTDGQLESVSKANGESEQMYWDDLALVKRGDTDYIVDPAVTGGNPIMANDKVLFNDILGTTLGVKDADKFSPLAKDSFGAGNTDGFFTGKPYVEGLGYNFLFRNYRQNLGKWQTADPLGYPDGWNNLAYVNNWTTSCIDNRGTDIWHIVDTVALGGKGHSAMIVGNSQSGYDYYSYSSAGVEHLHRDSFSQLVGTLQEARLSGGSSAYDKWQKWNTQPNQDDAAKAQTSDARWDLGNYDLTTNNCWLMVMESLEASGVPYAHDALSTAPNANFKRNVDQGAVDSYNLNDTSISRPE